jgi:hypothetical protein
MGRITVILEYRRAVGSACQFAPPSSAAGPASRLARALVPASQPDPEMQSAVGVC